MVTTMMTNHGRILYHPCLRSQSKVSLATTKSLQNQVLKYSTSYSTTKPTTTTNKQQQNPASSDQANQGFYMCEWYLSIFCTS